MGNRKAKPNYRRTVLRLPDLDHSKSAVLNSLPSPSSRRVYLFAINQFIAWYCSEPRLAFNRIVVVRYRMYLESRKLAANTINQQLAAVRRLAHEAADAGLLSPDLAAGISRVKGVKQLGCRSGNWLSLEQSSEVLSRAHGDRSVLRHPVRGAPEGAPRREDCWKVRRTNSVGGTSSHSSRQRCGGQTPQAVQRVASPA
jgi:hypothetical protein